MVQHLRALVALAEGSGFYLSTYMVVHHHPSIHPGDLAPSDLQWHQAQAVHIHSYIQPPNQNNNKNTHTHKICKSA